MSQFFESGGQRIGASASTSDLPMNIQGWFPLGLTGLISVQSKGLSRVFSSITVQKQSIIQCSAFSIVQLSHPHMTTGKTIPLTRWTFVGKVMSLLFNMLSRLVIAFLPRCKSLSFSWLQSPPSTVILQPKKIKSLTVSIVSPYTCHEVTGPDAMILAFWMLSFKPAFSLSSDCVDRNKLWKILKEMGIPEHLTCLLRNLYAGQEAAVRTTDWFQIGKGVRQGCILSPCLCNLYAEYIMRNAGLE